MTTSFHVLFVITGCILGAVFGSFISAWVWRIHEERSINERHSVCPSCQHLLGFLDLLPVVSHLWLRGRCRYCGQPIGRQYLVNELATGVLFVAVGYTVVDQPGWWVVVTLGVIWSAVALMVGMFVYDLKWMLLPDIWTYGLAGIAIIGSILAVLAHQPFAWQPLSQAPATWLMFGATLLTGVITAGFFLLIIYGSQAVLKRAGMGLGDAKLGLALGLLLGYPGIVVALYLAFIFGAVLSLALIATKRSSMQTAIPFGPFLLAGSIASIWLTPYVIQLYQSLL